MSTENIENIRLLIEALGSQVFESKKDPRGTVAMLITETIRFRDKLKEETGETLTVEDTRIALDALETYLTSGGNLPKDISPEQEALVQIWIDRLTIFGGRRL